MTDKPVKPLSERIREARPVCRHMQQIAVVADDNAVAASYQIADAVLGFLAELAQEQAEIKAMLAEEKK